MAFRVVISNFDHNRRLELVQELALDISVEEAQKELDNLPYETARIEDRKDAEAYADFLESLGAEVQITSSGHIEELDTRFPSDGSAARRTRWEKTLWGRHFIRTWPIVFVILVALSLVTPCGMGMFMLAADPHGTSGVGIFIVIVLYFLTTSFIAALVASFLSRKEERRKQS